MKERKRGGGGGIGGPFELLMREKLPRLFSINFSNYVAEDVPRPKKTISLHPSSSSSQLRAFPYHSYSRPRYP